MISTTKKTITTLVRTVIELNTTEIEEILIEHFKIRNYEKINFDWHIGQWVSLTLIREKSTIEESEDKE